MNKCIVCKKLFKTNRAFENHSCVKKAAQFLPEVLLKKLLETGGCSKEYYEKEMDKLNGAKNEK